ncbi:dephospho-CoA kinase [soil metagenome]
MLVLGLTGSLGMGKSTAATIFARAGAAVFDADRAVHLLYSGAAVAAVEAAFPGVAVDGVIDRARLATRLACDPAALSRLEAIVHPLVRAAETAFRARAAAEGCRVTVLDIPLLLETGGEGRVDAVVVVSTTAAIQRERALARPGMTEARFAALAARQMSDAEKRRRAHFVIDSGGPLVATAHQVADILRALAAAAAGR